MPFEQIYWNAYGNAFAKTGETVSSQECDVRFGVVATAQNMHSRFSYVGRRRRVMQDLMNLYIRDTRYPFNNLSPNNYKRTKVGQLSYWTDANAPMVFSWPGMSSSVIYGGVVNNMTTSNIPSSWGNRNNFSKLRNSSNTVTNAGDVTKHSTESDTLFQCQNRESAHHIHSIARWYGVEGSTPPNGDRIFCGIHIDNPLQVTTTKTFKGYRILLKRKKYLYEQGTIRLRQPSTPTVENELLDEGGTANGSFMVWDPDEVNKDGWPQINARTTGEPLLLQRAMRENMVLRNTHLPAGASVTAISGDLLPGSWDGTSGVRTLNLGSEGDVDLWYDYDVFYMPDGHVRWSNGATIPVQDAVIDERYNRRIAFGAGSVYLRDITIRLNDTVLKAKDDIIGEFQEVTSQEIYTDRSANVVATSSGSGNKTITLKNLYRNKSNIHTRYIHNSFKIKFGTSSTVHEIASVGSNNFTLKNNLSAAVSNSTFTLLIPRGSRDSNYTWGHYNLSSFGGEAYDGANCSDILFEPQVGLTIPANVIDIHPANRVQGDLYRLFNSSSLNTGGVKTGEAVRHPFFSCELSEALFYRKDFHIALYWRNIYNVTAAGYFGHVSSKVGSSPYTSGASENGKVNVTWSACDYANYWEKLHESSATNVATHKSGAKFGGLLNNAFSSTIWSERDQSGQRFSFSIDQFHYKGMDRASGALWPGYRNNTAALNLNLNGNLTSRFSVWASEHSQAYNGSGYAVVEELDYPLFGFCGTQMDTGYWIFPSFSTSRTGTRSNEAEVRLSLLYAGSFSSINFPTRIGDRRLNFNSSRLLHPWALACYGLSTDMLGWGQINALAEGGQASFHVMTIYDSNDVLPSGSTIKVALSQSPGLIPYPTLANSGADIEETQWGGDMNAMPPFDSYQLFVVAK